MSHFKIVVPQSSDITNLCTNPSFEINTTGWVAGSNWTLTRTAGNTAFRGIYDADLTASASPATIMATYAATLTASETYHITGWIRVVTWNGGNIYLASAGFTSATPTYNSFYIDGTSPKGAWIYLETKLVLDADNIGNITLFTNSAASTSDQVRFDMVNVTKTSSPITSFDGDTNNCYWTGTEHGSTSIAPAYTWNVGVETDFDDLNLTVLHGSSGLGAPRMRHITDQTQGHGAIFRRANALPRLLTITGYHPGTSRATLHSYRKDVLDVLFPNRSREKRLIRYYGANSVKPVELECVYDAGYEYNESTQIGFNEDIALRVIAYDPFWKELPQDKVSLTTRGTGTHDYISAKVDGDWTDLSSTFNGAIRAIIYDRENDILYVGGDFTSPHKYVSQYSGGSWSALGAGLNGVVRDLALDSNNDLYIGGSFTDVDGGPGGTYAYIVKWNGSSYSALGTGMNGQVTAVQSDSTGQIYVGGAFTTGNGVTVNYFTYWNGSTFVAMDSGVSSFVYSMDIDGNDDVYLGGVFLTAGAGATSVNYIAKWDGSAYSALGSGMNGQVNTITIDEGNNVYAGGLFTTADGITVNYIALWSGGGWYALGTGVAGGTVEVIGIVGDQVWVGGDFTSASGLDIADRIAIWNQSSWVHSDIDLPGSPTVRAILGINKTGYLNVYIGYSTTGSATYSVDTTVTNNGTSDVFPILTLWNEGATNTKITNLRNELTWATVWLNYTIQPNEKLIMDFNPINFHIESSFGRNVNYAILDGSDEDFYLRKGDNIITIFTPDASITGALTWRNAHGYADGVAA